MNVHSLMQVQTSAFGVVSRRTFLRSVAAGAAMAGTLGWKEAITLQAAELRKKGMSCILLFMNGGPSQFETFDPKPGTGNGGPTKAISTALSGVQIAEGWENIAKEMKDIALIRSVTKGRRASAGGVSTAHGLSAFRGREVSVIRRRCGQRTRHPGFRVAVLRQYRQSIQQHG